MSSTTTLISDDMKSTSSMKGHMNWIPKVNHVLFVINKEEIPINREFTLENLFFTCTHLANTWASLDEHAPGVILISTATLAELHRHIQYMREYCRHTGVPLILYSSKFESEARNIALKYGFDDYYVGSLSDNFLRKLEYIRRAKRYGHETIAVTYDEPDLQSKVSMWRLKRSFDVLVSVTLLTFCVPLFMMIALIIKLESRGPVFYFSKRAGNGYKIFNFYKFRSMRKDADKELASLQSKNQYEKAVFFKLKDDPRVTRFGAFLRKTSLDELPQLINVLKGDMSLVGNRPLPLYEAEKLTIDQTAWRFLAPAGITGLWQITKRGREVMSHEERIQLDIEYATKNSFLLDLKILVMTFPALLQKEKV